MAGIWLPHFKDLVVRPSLQSMGTYCATEAAVCLMCGTSLVESGIEFLTQFGLGPGLGINQIEPATINDIWHRWLRLDAQANLLSKIARLVPDSFDIERQVVIDLQFATVVARCKYLMAPASLPHCNDATGMADYHKKWYNTADGDSVPARNVPLFQSAINAC